jgi:hypothetical protein
MREGASAFIMMISGISVISQQNMYMYPPRRLDLDTYVLVTVNSKLMYQLW